MDHDYNGHFAHSFYYGVTVLPQGERHLPGEIVSYGVLIVLQLAKEYDELKEIRDFMISVGLPTSLEALEIESDEDLKTVLDKAFTLDHIQTSPFEINRQMVEDAIQEVEKLKQQFDALSFISSSAGCGKMLQSFFWIFELMKASNITFAVGALIMIE